MAPAGEAWLHEIKFDGYRAGARLERAKARKLTRSGLDWTGDSRGAAVWRSILAAVEELRLGKYKLNSPPEDNGKRGE